MTNQGNCTEGPPLIDGVEQRVLVYFGEFQTGKYTAGFQDAVSLPQCGRDVGEVSDAKGNGVQVEGVVFDLRGEHLGVGLEEGQVRLVRGWEVEGALFTNGKHVGVDVGYGDVDVGVAVVNVGVVKDAEGDVARAAGYVEDSLGLAERCGCSWVERGDEMVSMRWVC